MTRRQDLQHRRHSLNEIINILDAMKMLAQMESHHLEQCLQAQHRVVAAILTVANDFLSFYPQTLPESPQATPVYLMIGSERGFCGHFNHALLSEFEQCLQQAEVRPTVLVVGRKLFSLVEDDTLLHARIKGPSVAEDVPAVLEEIVETLMALQQQQPRMTLFGVYHQGEQGILTQQLLPPFQQSLLQQQPHQQQQSHQAQQPPPRFSYPPALNLSPTEFLLGVARQYLFAALHEVLYASLLEENRSRSTHLEGAVRHLEDLSGELAQQLNQLRREEITEEIEVLLLNAGRLEQERAKRR
ncbi:F0F1 ATP synthase subunit gamma [Photobacterium sp. MCCC 1A19761]|uniref:F0F1 ATP synthase subunit gamma n=1 Tax=Photobacterium sp. MCCC 1A19761 TaxID=3115000 RepID=UPI00307F5261